MSLQLNDYIPFMKVRNNASTPSYGSEFAAGADLRAAITSPVNIHSGCTAMIPTGIATSIPTGCFGALFARSGIASKRGLRPANCVGVIDSDYRGEIMVAMHNDSNEMQVIAPNERIAQLVIIPFVKAKYVEMEELDDTQRGNGGFGSTGTN